MSIRYAFSNWSQKEYLGTAAILLFILFLSIRFFNVEQDLEETVGTVEKLGIDTATYGELTELVLRVRLENGNKVTVYVPRHENFKPGDKVVLAESNYTISEGKKYRYLRRTKDE